MFPARKIFAQNLTKMFHGGRTGGVLAAGCAAVPCLGLTWRSGAGAPRSAAGCRYTWCYLWLLGIGSMQSIGAGLYLVIR
jgi:hypothetical protein